MNATSFRIRRPSFDYRSKRSVDCYLTVEARPIRSRVPENPSHSNTASSTSTRAAYLIGSGTARNCTNCPAAEPVRSLPLGQLTNLTELVRSNLLVKEGL